MGVLHGFEKQDTHKGCPYAKVVTMGGDPGAPLYAKSLTELLDLGDRMLERASAHPLLGDFVPKGVFTARGLFLALVGLLLLALLLWLVGGLHRRLRWLRPNFRGDSIPRSYGLVLLGWSAVMFSLTASLLPAARREYALWLFAVLGFGLLGFVDDTWGNRQIKGLRGHFRAAFRERRLTTGLLKAGGGGGLALWLGSQRAPESLAGALLAAALIALCANAVNLFDLRPGRAGAVFLLCAFPLAAFSFWKEKSALPPLVYVIVPSLVVWERDARAEVMLGDTGSNLLGASLGLALSSPLVPLPVQVGASFLLVGLHLLAERASLTAIIERSRVLRALDRLTGTR